MATPVDLRVRTELSKRPALEGNDSLALTAEQQRRLDQHKVQTRIETEHYLRKHPEVAVLLSTFIHDTLVKRPRSIREFAAEYFTDPSLPDMVKDKMKYSNS